MNGVRKKVSTKTKGFIRKAQQAPAPAPQGGPAMPKVTDPGAPAGGAPGAPVPGAPKPPTGGPGGAPGAPPAPPKDPVADVEQDKREEAKLEKLSEGLSKLEDKFDTLADAVIEMKDALVGDGKKDKFEEIKEEDDEVDDVSSEEFGIDKDNLVLSNKKEAAMPSAEELRTARKQRLAKDKKEGAELTFEMDDAPNKKYKQQVPSPTITKLKKAPEDWGQYRLSAMSLDLNASGDQWSLVNMENGDVYYTIASTDETKETFATEEFAKEIIKDMHELGVEAAMKKHAALPFEKEDAPDECAVDKLKKRDKKPMPFKKEKKDDLDGDKLDRGPDRGRGRMAADEDPVEQAVEEGAIEPIEEVASPEVEEALVEEDVAEEDVGITASDYHRRFLRAFRLALTAQGKNLIDNPLKGAMFSVLSELGVENPAGWVESIFAQAADDHFEVALSKTDEYLELSDEALIEAESLVGDLSTGTPVETEESADELRPTGSRAEALKRRARKASVPLSSSTVHETDRFSEISGALPTPKLAGIGRYKI